MPKRLRAITRKWWNAHPSGLTNGLYLQVSGHFPVRDLRSIHRYIGRFLAEQEKS